MFAIFSLFAQADATVVPMPNFAGGKRARSLCCADTQIGLAMFLAAFYRRRNLLRFVALLAVCPGGCVAMNVPSVRYDDPNDRGGLFGPHQKKDSQVASGPGCEDGMKNDVGDFSPTEDGFEPGLESSHEEKPPEVPWPRFHPLPTRPVFSVNR